jgi:hypothetical protein
MLRMHTRSIVLLGILAITTSLFAQNETITIQSHSKSPDSDVALLYGELDGNRVVLRCALSHSDCKELTKGRYNIERLLQGEGSYPNCPNVDIYRLGADSSMEEPLGEYCLREHK